MRNGLIASVLVVAMVAGATAGFVVGNANDHTTTVYSYIPITQTITVYSRTFTATSCTYTTLPEAMDCPHYWNSTWTISVEYAGVWVASYQGYLGGGENKSDLSVAGSFYGHDTANQSLTITGWTQGQAITVCAEAQKLDASGSTLVLRILPPVNVMNETSSVYGTTKTCLQDVIM
jgi:hypothetical protein